MNFSLRHTPFVASIRSAETAIETPVYDFGGAVNRFTGGGITADPTQYTLSAWLRPAQVALSTSVFVRSDGFPWTAWSHSIMQAPTGWVAYTFDGAPKGIVSSTVPVINQWYHVAATALNGGFQRLYVNGVEEGTPTAIGSLWTGGNDWWIAQDNGSSQTNYSGYMCDAAIWNVQLSAGEIAALATGVRNVPPSIQPANLILFCPMTDAPIGGALPGNYLETVGGLTQSRSGAPVGRLSVVSSA